MRFLHLANARHNVRSANNKQAVTVKANAVRYVLWCVIAILVCSNAVATERIARFKRLTISGSESGGTLTFLGHNETDQLAVSPFFNQDPGPLIEQEFARTTFAVYRTEEVDEKLAVERRTTDAALATTERSVDAKMTTFEGALRADVVRSIDAIPQRVLTNDAADAIKAAVIEQFRQELMQLREELKADILALQTPRDR